MNGRATVSQALHGHPEAVLLVCLTCSTRFAVGLPHCPGCTSYRCMPAHEWDAMSEEERRVAKFNAHGEVSNAAGEAQAARDAEAAAAGLTGLEVDLTVPAAVEVAAESAPEEPAEAPVSVPDAEDAPPQDPAPDVAPEAPTAAPAKAAKKASPKKA